MNERIKELSDIAYENHLARNPNSSFGRRTDYDKEFAELIVREMCQVINDDCQLQMRQRVLTNLGGLNQARELIKEHFGVEE